MGNTKPEEGVHEEIGATEMFSGKSQASTSQASTPQASTDESLNAAAKSHNSSSKHKLSKPWLFAIAVIAIVVISAIFATFTTQHQSHSLPMSSTISHKTVTIGLKLAPTNLDIRNQSGSALDQLLIGNVYEGLVARNAKKPSFTFLGKKLGSKQRWFALYVPSS